MEKKQRNQTAADTSAKSAFYPPHLIVSIVLGGLGAVILTWYLFDWGDPFPFASYIGVGLVITAAVIDFIFEKRKRSENPNNDPDILGL